MIKRIIKELTPPIFFKIINSLNKRIGIGLDIHYKIGRYDVILPSQHNLIRFQKNHKLYDRFLPVLARSIKQGDIIVDVGANVGDTAIMMLNETKADIICVEPSNKFFKYLITNVNNLPKEERNKLRCIQSLVGEQDLQGELVHSSGTASIERINHDNVKIEKERLDHILKDELKVSLIKVDTDGWDFDVILSAKKTIENNKPILFWENQINTLEQSNGYKKLYDFLSEMKYNHLYIFDNFGNIMIKNASYEVVNNINNYIYNTDMYGGTKTIYYTDILAITEDKKDLIQDVIDTYEREWINI